MVGSEKLGNFVLFLFLLKKSGFQEREYGRQRGTWQIRELARGADLQSLPKPPVKKKINE
jgi:hypothetical protein